MGIHVHDGCKNCGTTASNLCSACRDRKHRYKMPTDTEFSTLEAVVKVFEPLSYFTDALSGEKHVTASAIRPLLKHIHEKILLVSSNDCTITKEMKWSCLMTLNLVIQPC